MPDLTGTAIASNYRKHHASQSGVGRELIVKVAKTNMTDVELHAYIDYMTLSHGVDGAGDSAFTVGGLCASEDAGATWGDFTSGTSDIVMLRLQGTGDLTVASVEALTGSPTVTIEAIFAPLK